ncbi:GNAT family N-acetyltransferase [Paludicola sp. MB14-C6]|uniref:GNAT family N-acetyltransferase n=1 Tax=Paludihabitans sp. MB14-C6 TaxID=3070656 RepID=UPI0027DD0960|nr:GNAT family N-acetyltransferase [Paludicola sp. MB14-C6]WMJ22483.1 GNAT family N-acetyltransferase [Paludicola sp. MB14-C6]
MDTQILNCETQYAKCFCHLYEDETVIRIRDSELEDMYYHNYTNIKQSNKTNLIDIIKTEIQIRKQEQKDFCNVFIWDNYDNSLLTSFNEKPDVSRNGFYLFDISEFPKMVGRDDCYVEKVVSQNMIEDILYCNLQLDEEILGKHFCQRRCYRRSKVYLSDDGVNSYVCYYNGKPVGNCDLFVHKNTAKIEDFTVIPNQQRKGFGTAILKSLINIALKAGCDKIYLVTDEEDTAKNMYQKIGFHKIGERLDLFFKL